MRRTNAIAILFIAVATSGCLQYRQNARNVTPAPQGPECPDMAVGCKKTVWALGWGLLHLGQPPSATCGDVGLQEVTVRAQPATFLISMITAGLVTPRRIEWKCAAPTPKEGDIRDNQEVDFRGGM